MAEVNTDKGKNDGKKGKQKKMTVRETSRLWWT